MSNYFQLLPIFIYLKCLKFNLFENKSFPIYRSVRLFVTLSVYLDIKESPYQQSAFNKKNKNSVYKSMKNILGPFIIHRAENRSGTILEYNTNYSTSKKFMTVF